jgi:hypothetical protein
VKGIESLSVRAIELRPVKGSQGELAREYIHRLWT